MSKKMASLARRYMKRDIEKIGAFIILCCMVFTIPSDADDYVCDNAYGRMVASFSPEAQTTAKVVIIEDAHCNEEVQNNIIHIVSDMLDRDQSEITVGIEGAYWGVLDTEILKLFDDQKQSITVFNEMLHQGELGAIEYLHVTRHDFELYGLEEKSAYINNISSYQTFTAQYGRQKQELVAIERMLRIIQDVVLPEQYKVFEKQTNAFYDNKDSEYLSRLMKMASLYEVDIEKNTALARLWNIYQSLNELDQEQLTSELAVIQQAHGDSITLDTAYDMLPNEVRGEVDAAYELKKNALLRASLLRLDYRKVCEDIEALSRDILHAMVVDPEGIALLYHLDTFDIMSKLLTLKLTPEEYSLYSAEMSGERFNALLDYIQSYKPNFNTIINYDDFIDQRSQFYMVAQKRDQIMADNIITLVKKYAAQDHITAAVVGGFHVPGICRYLAEKKVGYIVVRPTVTSISETDQDNYFRILKGTDISEL